MKFGVKDPLQRELPHLRRPRKDWEAIVRICRVQLLVVSQRLLQLESSPARFAEEVAADAAARSFRHCVSEKPFVDTAHVGMVREPMSKNFAVRTCRLQNTHTGNVKATLFFSHLHLRLVQYISESRGSWRFDGNHTRRRNRGRHRKIVHTRGERAVRKPVDETFQH